MKIAKIAFMFALLGCLALGCILADSPAHASSQVGLDQAINSYVQGQWQSSKIPGLAVSVIQNNQIIYHADDGYADTSAKRPVTSSTLFELGSNTKAFTALAILQLENQGLIAGQAPVSRYLPWFWMQYQGQRAVITVDQLMHHTSGIAAETIGTIPASTATNALPDTVHMLVGTALKHRPGLVFEYATINYDVLGLIIESVTGQSYGQYIRDQLLVPLGLTHTYVGRDSLKRADLPIGYKIFFGNPARYDAPDYRGNTPAGYIISNQEDMIRWSEIQLGTVPVPTTLKQLILQSHLPDRSVSPAPDGSSYAGGWSVFQIGSGEISHDGSNPNFSSFIGLLPTQNIAVVVLANMDYNNTHDIGQGVVDLILGRDLPKTTSDLYMQVDGAASFVIAICVPVALMLVWFLLDDLRESWQRKRRLVPFSAGKVAEVAISLTLLGLFAWSLYDIPTLIVQGVPWAFILVWGPNTLLYALELVALVGGLTYLYYLMTTLTSGTKDRPYYWLTVFSVISGIGNAFIIFVINETFVRTDNLTNGLLFYFIMGIITYVFGQRFVRRKVIGLTNNLLFTKRVELLRALRDTAYGDFESLQRGSVLAGLNNDTEVISNTVSIAITGLTNLATLICCLAYLGFMNLFGLLIAFAVIVSAASFYFLMGQRAEKLWEGMRDSQNQFFQLINDLLDGFKELQLNSRRRVSFQSDIEASCEEYKEKRMRGEMGFANVFVVGELLFVIVIGFVAFFYPSIFPDIGQDILRNYIFVFLYMTGPVNAVLEAYPQVIRMRISWRRIGELSQLLTKTRSRSGELEAGTCVEAALQLSLENLQFHYTEKDGQTFTLGPIDYTFQSGEIAFITGGNGSGKSTLAKLMTGLYTPNVGCVRINGDVVTAERLSEYYSAIFSDFYLFEKLYGLDLEGKEREIQDYLASLQISEKVHVQDGRFSTTRLSSGQRKRLALLVSYLEDRQICLYDEWASDQDPEYRAFFYHDILTALRDRGKCVIVITHDDRYFGLADKILKLEVGKVVPVLMESK